MKAIQDVVHRKPWVGWLLFFATAAVVFLIGLLAASIVERRSESVATRALLAPIPEWEPRSEVWGRNFPRQYETFARTAERDFASSHGGSRMIDYLDANPSLVVLWAGYAFSKDYNQGRGHAYAVTDARATLRTTASSPAVCWTCKSPDVPRVMAKLGGPAEFYKKTWVELGPEITHPVGCRDCHDPATLELKITRPALLEAFWRAGKDVERATHQEMRTLVCAQCHVEYYFKKEGNYLAFPWDMGRAAEEIEAYYDSLEFADWTHGLSRAPMLKAQHPDYELFLTGVHAQRDVACADCHMPYRSEGGVKFTDHHVRSPLHDIAGSCQVCHREKEQVLAQSVTDRQDKIEELKRLAEKALVRAHAEAKAAWDRGAADDAMRPILTLIRHAQWRWDFVASSNGVGFHSPLECARVLGTAIEKAQEARLALARLLASLGVAAEVEPPPVGDKAGAQAAIGLDMEKVRAEKEKLLEIIAEWDATATPVER